MAIRAVRSTLDARPEDRVSILVSDNSTDASEMAILSAFCRDLKDNRVHYVHPPEPMKMAMHWEWAFQQALERFDASHFTLLADRRIYRRGGLHELCDLARSHPDSVIATYSDNCFDDAKPIRLASNSCSGRLFKIRSEDLLKANSLAILDAMVLVPTPFISIIPRRLFGQVREKFGDCCLSLAPDYCLGYRILDLEDSILVYDKAMSLMLGMARSNGMALMRGTTSKDKTDFIATNGGEEFRFWKTPIPQIFTGMNGIFHEYIFIRDQAHSGRFPELDLQGYLANLHHEITTYFKNPELKEQYLALLESHGFQLPKQPPAREGGPPPRRTIAQRFRAIRESEPDKPLWALLLKPFSNRIWLLKHMAKKTYRNRPSSRIRWGLHRVAGLPLPTWMNDLGFDTLEESIEFFNGKRLEPARDLERVLKFEVETA